MTTTTQGPFDFSTIIWPITSTTFATSTSIPTSNSKPFDSNTIAPTMPTASSDPNHDLSNSTASLYDSNNTVSTMITGLEIDIALAVVGFVILVGMAVWAALRWRLISKNSRIAAAEWGGPVDESDFDIYENRKKKRGDKKGMTVEVRLNLPPPSYDQVVRGME